MTLTPKEFAFADTRELCAGIGLPWKPGGYGLLFCVDDNGGRVTAVTDDVEYLDLLSESPQSIRAGLDVAAEKFTMTRPGWPDEWAAS